MNDRGSFRSWVNRITCYWGNPFRTDRFLVLKGQLSDRLFTVMVTEGFEDLEAEF
jgi:hypothetical protein